MITCREIVPDDWKLIESLFGPRGACGGCWCMAWRVPIGGKTWTAACGEPNKRAFRKLVTSGEALGILAFDKDTPVGWCSFGRRIEFPRLERVKAYHRDDIDKVWSINCFYIAKGYRGQGMAHKLAQAAVKAITKRKGKLIEAYPVVPARDGNHLPAAFSWTGPDAVFEQLGFSIVQQLSKSRPLYRLEVK